MEQYKIGSKVVVNDKEFEIMDIWEGNDSISEDGESPDTEIYFATLKDSNGKMVGPVQIMMHK
jgi:hypothetical protein